MAHKSEDSGSGMAQSGCSSLCAGGRDHGDGNSWGLLPSLAWSLVALFDPYCIHQGSLEKQTNRKCSKIDEWLDGWVDR